VKSGGFGVQGADGMDFDDGQHYKQNFNTEFDPNALNIHGSANLSND
jgi:hypothetical protein